MFNTPVKIIPTSLKKKAEVYPLFEEFGLSKNTFIIELRGKIMKEKTSNTQIVIYKSQTKGIDIRVKLDQDSVLAKPRSNISTL